MKKKKIIFFCVSLIFLGIIVSATILFTSDSLTNDRKIRVIDDKSKLSFSINTISPDDNVLGNPNANVVMIHYSDPRCPKCREFHPTIIKLVSNYAKSGDFAWVYRHFPIEDAAGKANNSASKKSAIASECVKEIAGSGKFFDFIHEIYTKLPLNFDENDLQTLVNGMGINTDLYTTCINSGKYDSKIQKNIDDGLSISKNDKDFGTPYNIFITRDGRYITLPGPQSYSTLDKLIKIYSSQI